MSGYYRAGRYRLKVLGAALGQSKESGTPQVEVAVQPVCYYEPDEPGVTTTVDGPSRTVFLSLTEGTLGTPDKPGWVWQTLKDLGFEGPSFADLAPLEGKVREGEMRLEEYNGTERERWALYRQRGAEPVRPADAKVVRELSSKFSALLRSGKAGAKPKAAGPATEINPPKKGKAEPAASHEGHDIPF